jgi:hypothetical protein
MTKIQIAKRVKEILDACCEDPSEAMIKEGQALVDIGKALKGLSIADAKATMGAVALLSGIEHPQNQP